MTGLDKWVTYSSLLNRVPGKPARLTSWLSARQISHSAGRFLSWYKSAGDIYSWQRLISWYIIFWRFWSLIWVFCMVFRCISGSIYLRLSRHMTRFLDYYWLNLKLKHVTKSSTPSKCQQNSPNYYIKIKTTNNMASRHSTPLENDTIASRTSSIASRSTLPNAFSRMMGLAPVIQSTAKRDCCIRPTP